MRGLARLARHYDLVPDAAATQAVVRAAPQLARVSGERVRDEFVKMLAARALTRYRASAYYAGAGPGPATR